MPQAPPSRASVPWTRTFCRFLEPPLSVLPSPMRPVSTPSTRQLTDRKSTRLNSSHITTSYAVLCLKKNNQRRPGRHPGARIAAPRRAARHRGLWPRQYLFFIDPPPPEIYTLSLHDALPI